MIRLQSGHKDENFGTADSFSSSSQIVARKAQSWKSIPNIEGRVISRAENQRTD